jgi:hypothetical protein
MPGLREGLKTTRPSHWSWMAASGHEDAFPRPRLSARCRFSQGTFAGTWGNGRDAPIAVTREASVNSDIAPPCLVPRRSTISVR